MLTWMLKSYFRQHLRPDIYGEGLRGMARQAMCEVPAPTLCFITTTVGFAAWLPYHINRVEKTGKNKKRYMFRWAIYRPDDPRLDFVLLPPKQDAELQELRKKMA